MAMNLNHCTPEMATKIREMIERDAALKQAQIELYAIETGGQVVECANPTCRRRFIVGRLGHVYCSRRCANTVGQRAKRAGLTPSRPRGRPRKYPVTPSNP